MMFGLIAGAVAIDVWVDMFLTGAVAGLTIVTTGSKIKKTVYSSKK